MSLGANKVWHHAVANVVDEQLTLPRDRGGGGAKAVLS